MKLTPKMCLEVASHEAIIRQTYVDSVGVNTWSVGLTNATGHNVERYINNPAPLQHCLNIFVWALDNYANVVREVFADHPLTEEQFTAALSFTWNLGAGNLRGATWVKRFKAGDYVGAREAFLWFNKPKEIIGRRKKEAALFFDGHWSNDGTMTEYTRVTRTRSPDWRSAKRIDVRAELVQALKVGLGVGAPVTEHAGYEPSQSTPTLTSVAAPKPKPEFKSTTNWSAIGGFFTTVVTSLSALDPIIAVPIILVAGGFAFWIIRERMRKGSEFGI